MIYFLAGNLCSNKSRFNEENSTDHTIQENKLNFQEYWNIFRESVVKFDTTKLFELCNFPITIKGDQDEEPVVRLNKNNFSTFFKFFLKREVYKKNFQHMTNLDFIKREQIANKSFGYQETEYWARVGDLEFAIVNNHWRLSLIYYPKDLLKKNLPFLTN